MQTGRRYLLGEEVAEVVAFRVWVAALAISFALRQFDRGRQPT